MKNIFLFAVLFSMSFLSFADDNPLWMRYPAISPDGSTIVFSFQGDLFLVSASGGEARLLTYHEAYDYHPVWSPDGKTIAFASVRYGGADVFIIPAEGGKAIRLTTHSGSDIPSSFSPDGKEILFEALIQDDPKNVQFPTGLFTELYKVPIEGGRPERVLSTPANEATYSKDMKKILYCDSKGYEDHWRKHHTSAVTRDIWLYDSETGKHRKLSQFEGEDMYPVFSPDNKDVYYLSEASGSFNIWKQSLAEGSKAVQLSFFDKHPIRFLSISDEGKLCFSFNGEIYTGNENGGFTKVPISITNDERENPVEFMNEMKGVSEIAVSPDGNEIAFIIRGEVFVTSTDFPTTKRITNTPQQERSVSFSPDGRSILYASERDSSWNIYSTSIVNEDEATFAMSTILIEKPILTTEKEEFEPRYSPDGKEVAYLEEREVLKVVNLESGKTRIILPKKYNYSYADGDQDFAWSPDGKWLLVEYSPHSALHGDIALVDAEGKQEIVNLTNSGYADYLPRWMMDGKMMLWYSDREGFRSHGSWGSEGDIYGMFFTKDAFDEFNLSKEERALKEKKEKEKKEAETEEGKKDDKKKDKKEEKESLKAIEIDLKNIEDRKKRLTIHSSQLADAIITPDGKKLFYLSMGEKGFDLWVQDFVEDETKILAKIGAKEGGDLYIDKKGENVFVFTGEAILKIGVSDAKQTPVIFQAEYYVNKPLEREYMFEHVWRQVQKKFYDSTLHGVDWDFYKTEYERFLPYINNNYDFTNMLSEMLGELNASHTGSGYISSDPTDDATACLGLFYDFNAEGNGLVVEEIVEKGPFDNAETKLKSGMIIEQIDGIAILEGEDYFPLLNHKAGKPVLIGIYDPKTKKHWQETVKPISRGQEYELYYKRWVKNRRQETERLSNGRIGYIHVRGMNSQSFREVYSEALGRNFDKEALIIDTRFNGGGWLHDDLASFLNGEKYASFWPRGHKDYGGEPLNKWYKPSIVLISESNYSDAHGFPFAYRAMDVGKTVGMPVPGTMTAVWWELLQDNTVYFGIPQIGVKDMNGNYLENQQFEPDIKVAQDYDVVITGRDQQVEMAVEVMLSELDAEK